MLEREREQVAASAHRLAALGLTLGTAGNVSLRCGERILVTSTGAVLEQIQADEISIVDRDGASLYGPAPTSELALHLGAYARFGPGAVVHAHAPVATALACVLCYQRAGVAGGAVEHPRPCGTCSSAGVADVLWHR